jgi:HEAT repeat protein
MRRTWTAAALALATAGSVTAQVSPLPPTFPGTPPASAPPAMPGPTPGVPNPKAPGMTPPGVPEPPTVAEATPPPPVGLPTTAGVPFDPTKVQWPTDVAGKSISVVVHDLKSDDPTVQEEALRMIRAFGPEAARKSAMTEVLALLDDNDPGVRINAILLIGAYGFQDTKSFDVGVDKLSKLLGRTGKGSIYRLHLVRTLSQLGPEAHAAIPEISQVADDHSWEVRAAAAEALGRLGAPAYEYKAVLNGPAATKTLTIKRPASVTAMAKLSNVLLSDRSSAVRMEACHALINLGPPQPKNPQDYVTLTMPYLQKITGRIKNEKEPAVKVWLNLLNMMYDGRIFDSTLQLLQKDVNSPDQRVRLQALAALNVLGPAALPALPGVATRLHSGTPVDQVAAIQTMLALGEETAQTVLPELERFVTATRTDPKQKDIHDYAALAAAALRKANPAAAGAAAGAAARP